MENYERIELIEQAIMLIEEAEALVDEAIKDTHLYPHYKAYGKYGINTALGNGNPYDNSLNTLIEEIEENEGEIK